MACGLGSGVRHPRSHCGLLPCPSCGRADSSFRNRSMAVPIDPRRLGLVYHLPVERGRGSNATGNDVLGVSRNMRWRIKFMLLGWPVVCGAGVPPRQALVLPTDVLINARMISKTGPRSYVTTINAAALLLGCLLMLRSLFRGLSEVAVYPSHKNLRKSVIGLVAGLYFLIVGVLAKVVEHLGLTGSFPLRAFLILVALVVVTVLLLSDRVQLHTRRFLSRYLQRPLYDYRTVWRRFTEDMASRLTQKELCQASVKLAADIFQALSVSIWLMDDQGENLELAASTSLSGPMAEELRPTREEASRIDPGHEKSSGPGGCGVLRRELGGDIAPLPSFGI